MATTKSKKSVSKNADRANAVSERRGRGPAIPRETRDGRPTAYAVKKDIWSSRGELKAKGVPRLDDGVIVKSAAIRLLSKKADTAAAPFVLKGHVIVPA